MAEAILFDLGNTLVSYFGRAEFPAILKAGILGVRDYLQEQGMLRVDPETMWHGVRAEDHEAEDHRVRPLEGRLARIFQLEPDQVAAVAGEMCRRFTAPIFARGRCYEDTLPTLQALRAGGYRLAVVSTRRGKPQPRRHRNEPRHTQHNHVLLESPELEGQIEAWRSTADGLSRVPGPSVPDFAQGGAVDRLGAARIEPAFSVISEVES